MKKMIILVLGITFFCLQNLYSQRLKFVEHVVFEFDHNIKLHMIASLFDSTKHNIQHCNILDWSGVCLIDGAPFLGTDWEMPKSVLKRAYIEINGKEIELETFGMYNPWFVYTKKEFFSVEGWTESGWIVRGFFSDGAGSYVAEWKIINGASIRTILSNDEYLIAKFYNEMSD